MLIYFIRHGHPDYKNDCLTELGKRQAAAAAERLRDAGIEKIFSSTNGRAVETAEYTARLLGLEVDARDFLREISWGSRDGEPLPSNGNPWRIVESIVAEGGSLADSEWYKKEPFCRSVVKDNADAVARGFDDLLCELGYTREGEHYRVTRECEYKTIAIFSHGGSSTAALSHFLNIPLTQLCAHVRQDFTAISAFNLPGEVGALIFPRIKLLNDSDHIKGIE